MNQVTFSKIIGDSGIFIDGDWVESKDQDVNGDVRLIQLADIGDGYFIDKSNRFLTSQKAQELKCTYLKPGDLLIARMPDPLGRACLFPDLEVPCVTVVDVCIVRPDSNIANVNWLKFSVNSPDFRNKIKQYIKGTTRQRISRGNLEKIHFYLPSIPDQLHIANLLSKAENLISQRKESIRLLDEFLKSTFLEMFGSSLLSNKGFEKKMIGQLLLNTSNDSPSKFPNKSYEYIDISSIDNISKKIKETKIILGANAPSRAKQLVQVDDILVSTVRPNLNAVAKVIEKYSNPIASTGFCILRPNQKIILTNYLFEICKQDFFIGILSKVAKGASYPAVSDKQIKDIKIPVPPTELQTQFAQIVEKTEALKTQYQQSLRELENLYGSLSQKAFKGELILNKSKEQDLMAAEPEAKYNKQ